ncbi:GMC oxidoreductase family protein [Plesiocystis pacifica SIR-1]|uniref:Cholesterol oxidase n=1 Tax=Plesiocystis pacifica SIR-1 TaxID=391625 RepID=A6G3U5_9BACT|nr:GMC family oxidoreductase [Plesiocystis pacifica]EDM79482.1 GMC oxidoreductase family protein [Plesiocystis pacifica SIR-1]
MAAPEASAASIDHDYIIIGSGFGGSVSAMRLVEKGYDVLMLEKGRELKAADFPKTNWRLRRWLWMPRLGFRGLFQMRFFRHITVLAGAGVGGGSLVYANTLPIPKSDFFSASSWAELARWERELMPHYLVARRMLGARKVPFLTKPDRLLKQIAEDRGQPEAFESTEVAVYFGAPKGPAGEAPVKPGATHPDPYFGGEGPERTACIQCGACMTGCRHGAKNTLDKNYLFFARKHGMKLRADCEVVDVRPLPPDPSAEDPDAPAGYEVITREGTGVLNMFRKRGRYTAKKVIFAAGVLGSVDLLLRLREGGSLPKLSGQIGYRVRTNSESLIGVVAGTRDEDMSRGVAIGSIYQTDDHSHLEVVRYGDGSGFFRTLMAPHVGGNAPGPLKLVQAAARSLRQPLRFLKSYFVPHWARNTIILLYMRTMEGTLRMRHRGFLTRRLASDLEGQECPVASIPEATELAEAMAEKTQGFTGSILTETALNIPTTAHILGGACMGRSAKDGVIDEAHRVFGYAGLYVIDGSAISANPGVNPSLTITALAERAMSKIPCKQTGRRSPLPAQARSALPLLQPGERWEALGLGKLPAEASSAPAQGMTLPDV